MHLIVQLLTAETVCTPLVAMLRMQLHYELFSMTHGINLVSLDAFAYLHILAYLSMLRALCVYSEWI